MQRILHFLLLTLLLTGCQTAALTELDYDTRQDFSLWQSWQWADPDVEFLARTQTSDLDRQRVREVVGEQLMQWGYLSSEQPDFLVRARIGQEERTQQIYVHRPGYWGDPWGPYWGGGWVETREMRIRVFILQLDILDAGNGQLVWRASEQWPTSSSATRPRKREEEIRKAARRLLQNFPPD